MNCKTLNLISIDRYYGNFLLYWFHFDNIMTENKYIEYIYNQSIFKTKTNTANWTLLLNEYIQYTL